MQCYQTDQFLLPFQGGASGSGGRIPSSSEDDDDIGYLNFHMDDNLQKVGVFAWTVNESNLLLLWTPLSQRNRCLREIYS